MRLVLAAAGLMAAMSAMPVLVGSAEAATFYATTGLGSQESTIQEGVPLSWGFNAEPAFDVFNGMVVAIKHGPDATFGIQLELIDMNSSVIGSVSYVDVAAFVLAGGSDAFEKFVFAVNVPFGVPLTSGDPYTVRLSLVGSGGDADEVYSIRGLDGGIALTNDAAEDIVVSEAPQPGPTETPEPASALLLAAGVLGLGALRRRAG